MRFARKIYNYILVYAICCCVLLNNINALPSAGALGGGAAGAAAGNSLGGVGGGLVGGVVGGVVGDKVVNAVTDKAKKAAKNAAKKVASKAWTAIRGGQKAKEAREAAKKAKKKAADAKKSAAQLKKEAAKTKKAAEKAKKAANRAADGVEGYQDEDPDIKMTAAIMVGLLYIMDDCQFGTLFALDDGVDDENTMCMIASSTIGFLAPFIGNQAGSKAYDVCLDSVVCNIAPGPTVTGMVAFYTAYVGSLAASLGILKGIAEAAQSTFKVCDNGSGTPTPMAYQDSQIKHILTQMGVNPTVENIIDKYDKICIQSTTDSEYKWMKYGDCWWKNGVKLCVYSPKNIDQSMALCARVSSTCPCAMAIGKGLIDAPEYDADSNGVMQTNSDGTLKIKNDGTHAKRSGDYYKSHAGIHCKALRQVNKHLTSPRYTGIIDDICNTWSGYSKNRVTLSAGVVQCVVHTMRNLFEKPMLMSNTNVTMTAQQEAQYNAYSDDYTYVQSIISLISIIENTASTNSFAQTPEIDTLINGIQTINDGTIFIGGSISGMQIAARPYTTKITQIDLSNLSSTSTNFYNNVNTSLGDLNLLLLEIDTMRSNYMADALNSEVKGITSFQTLQGALVAIIFVVLILYFIIVGFKMINGEFSLDPSVIAPLFIDFALVYYFAVGSAWKDFVLNITINAANGFAMFAMEIPLSSVNAANAKDGCNFNQNYYIPSSNIVTSQSTPCPGGTAQTIRKSYTCNTPASTIIQATPCSTETNGTTQMFKCGSSAPQISQCTVGSTQNYVCTTPQASNAQILPCYLANGTTQDTKTDYICTTNTTMCDFPPNTPQKIVTYDPNKNPVYGCMRGPYIPQPQYEQIYKPVMYDSLDSNGIISKTWLPVYCYSNDDSTQFVQANLIQNSNGRYQNLTCNSGYTMEDGYRASALNAMGIINSELVTTDNSYNIMHTAIEITENGGQVTNIINNIVNQTLLAKTSSLKHQHVLLVESMRAAANRNERYYPILHPYGPSGPTIDMSYVSLFDTIDCKAMSYFGYTPTNTEDIMYVKLMGGMSTSFPFGWIVIFMMVTMGISLISILGSLVQKYLVSFCGLMILFFMSPIVFTCKLFPQTAGYFDEWLKKVIGFLSAIPLSFFMIGFTIVLYDYAMYGSPAIYNPYNPDGTPNINYIQVFNNDGTINPNCANNSNLSTAPLVCLAYYFLNHQSWIGIPLSSITIPKPNFDSSSFLYIFKTLAVGIAISLGTGTLMDMLEKILASVGIGADTSLQGSMFNSNSSFSDQVGARAKATASAVKNIPQDIGRKGVNTIKQINSEAAQTKKEALNRNKKPDEKDNKPDHDKHEDKSENNKSESSSKENTPSNNRSESSDNKPNNSDSGSNNNNTSKE